MRPEKVPRELATLRATHALEDAFEQLDERYGDPEGEESTLPEDAVTRVADAILASYRVWTCEEVARVVVDVRAWVKEHRPDWLEATEEAHSS